MYATAHCFYTGGNDDHNFFAVTSSRSLFQPGDRDTLPFEGKS
ncbi:MAG: hypothetical protein AAFW67_07925 [Cyanobacteria bacterium J06638_38]